jgi:hypothetical protein
MNSNRSRISLTRPGSAARAEFAELTDALSITATFSNNSSNYSSAGGGALSSAKSSGSSTPLRVPHTNNDSNNTRELNLCSPSNPHSNPDSLRNSPMASPKLSHIQQPNHGPATFPPLHPRKLQSISQKVINNTNNPPNEADLPIDAARSLLQKHRSGSSCSSTANLHAKPYVDRSNSGSNPSVVILNTEEEEGLKDRELAKELLLKANINSLNPNLSPRRARARSISVGGGTDPTLSISSIESLSCSHSFTNNPAESPSNSSPAASPIFAPKAENCPVAAFPFSPSLGSLSNTLAAKRPSRLLNTANNYNLGFTLSSNNNNQNNSNNEATALSASLPSSLRGYSLTSSSANSTELSAEAAAAIITPNIIKAHRLSLPVRHGSLHNIATENSFSQSNLSSSCSSQSISPVPHSPNLHAATEYKSKDSLSHSITTTATNSGHGTPVIGAHRARSNSLSIESALSATEKCRPLKTPSLILSPTHSPNPALDQLKRSKVKKLLGLTEEDIANEMKNDCNTGNHGTTTPSATPNAGPPAAIKPLPAINLTNNNEPAKLSSTMQDYVASLNNSINHGTENVHHIVNFSNSCTLQNTSNGLNESSNPLPIAHAKRKSRIFTQPPVVFQ